MSALSWSSIIIGLVLVLFGTVFALQGANVLKGSAVMSGDTTYIYVGAILAIIGLVLIIAGGRSTRKASSTLTREGAIKAENKVSTT